MVIVMLMTLTYVWMFLLLLPLQAAGRPDGVSSPPTSAVFVLGCTGPEAKINKHRKMYQNLSFSLGQSINHD